MCLPNFVEFKKVLKSESLTGYRIWKNSIKEDNLDLLSQYQDYIWKPKGERHKVTREDSGIYSYNNNYYNNYYNNNNYIGGIIFQYGKTAIHKIGYRSEYAKISTLFTIRESDAKGPQEFLDWIKKFNNKISLIAERYGANTIHWQDFKEISDSNNANQKQGE